MKGFSIILCVYNSEQKLAPTLEHLYQLEVPVGYEWEIVVVDNNSTDGTIDVIREGQAFAPVRVGNANHDVADDQEGPRRSLPRPTSRGGDDMWKSNLVKIFNEKQQGLVYARIKGVQEARFEYIVFCDDDNWLAKDYLMIAAGILESDEQIGAIGGKGSIVSEGVIPDWFESFQSIYACGPQARQSGDVSRRGYMWGAGLVSSKSILKEVFHPDYPMVSTGRSGGAMSSGEDTEMCMRILLLGYKLWYEEKLSFQHAIVPERLTEEYRDRLKDGLRDFIPIKRLYSWEVQKNGRTGLFVFWLFIKNLLNYLLLKLRWLDRQQRMIVNPLKLKAGPETALIQKFARYANHI